MPFQQTANYTKKGPVSFFPRLEALRGVAALTVAAFHASQTPWKAGIHPLSTAPDRSGLVWGVLFRVYSALCNGHGAVILFFVLSGFVLSLSLERDFSKGGPVARRFFVGRACRIYPAVVTTVLLFGAVFWMFGVFLLGVTATHYDPAGLLRNMLLLDTDIDGVMWSLQLEVIASPLILLTVLMLRRGRGAFAVVSALILVALSFVGQWDGALGGGRTPLGPLYAFVFGILTARIGRRLVSGPRTRFAGALFLGATLLFYGSRPLLGAGSKWSPLGEAVAAAVLIAVLAYADNSRFARPLDWPFLRLCGRVSYSFYLLHPLTLTVIWAIPASIAAALNAGVPSLLIALVLAIASIGVILPVAWLNWRFVELPGIALGRRLAVARLPDQK